MNNTHRSRIILAAFLIGGFIFLFGNLPKAHGQTQPVTSTPTQIPTNIPTESPLSTAIATGDMPSQRQVDELLKTYTEVLDTSKSTIVEVHKSFDTVLNLAGLLFTAISVAGVGAGALLSSTSQKTAEQTAALRQKAEDALMDIKRTEIRALELEQRNKAALETANEVVTKQNDLRKQIENAENTLKDLQKEINLIKNLGEQDRQIIKRPLTLMQIDDHGIQLLSGNAEKKNGSIAALIEMSARSDAVVRRRSIKTLGILEEYDERVVKRMKEIITADSAQGVRKEAEKTLKLIEAKVPQKVMRRKS